MGPAEVAHSVRLEKPEVAVQGEEQEPSRDSEAQKPRVPERTKAWGVPHTARAVPGSLRHTAQDSKSEEPPPLIRSQAFTRVRARTCFSPTMRPASESQTLRRRQRAISSGDRVVVLGSRSSSMPCMASGNR